MRFPLIAAGLFTLLAEASGGEPTPRAVTVHAVDAEGKALPESSVTVRGVRGAGASLRGRDGVAEVPSNWIQGLLGPGGTGPLCVDVGWAVDDAGTPLPLAPERVGPLTTWDAPVRVALRPSPWFSGVVVDETGAPVADARVLVATAHERDLPAGTVAPAGRVARDGDAPGSGPLRVDGSVLADGAGRFRCSVPVNAWLTVGVETDAAHVDPTPVLVDPSLGPARLLARRARRVRVRLCAPDGTPIPGAHVWARPTPQERGSRAYAGPDGWAVLERIDPERVYEALEVYPLHARSDVPWSDVVRAWRPAEGDIRVTAARTFVGRVVDEEGRPCVGVRVGNAAESWSSNDHVLTDDEGAFRLERQAIGTKRLWASYYVGDHAWGTATDVAPEAGPLRLVLAGSRRVRVKILGSPGWGNGSGGAPMPGVSLPPRGDVPRTGSLPGHQGLYEEVPLPGLPANTPAVFHRTTKLGRTACVTIPPDATEAETTWIPTVGLVGVPLGVPPRGQVRFRVWYGPVLLQDRTDEAGDVWLGAWGDLEVRVAAEATLADGRPARAEAVSRGGGRVELTLVPAR